MGEQGCGQNLRLNSFLDCRLHGPAALTGFLNNAREFAQCEILGQSHDCLRARSPLDKIAD